jgi:hypothetical protein
MTKDDDSSGLDLGLQEILHSLTESKDADTIIKQEPSPELHSDLSLKIIEIHDQILSSSLSEILIAPVFAECLSVPIISSEERGLLLSCGNLLLERLKEKKEFAVGAALVKELLHKDTDKKYTESYRLFCHAALEGSQNKSLSPHEMKESLLFHDLLKSIPTPSKEISFASSVVSPEIVSTFPKEPQTSLQRPSKKFFILSALFLLLGIFASWFFFVLPEQGDFSDSFSETSMTSLANVLEPERDDVSNLDALMYNVQEDEQRSISTPVPQIVAAEKLQVPTVVPALPKTRATIDTSGPVEPRKVEDLFNSKNASRYEGDAPREIRERQPDPEPLSRRDPPSRPGRFETGIRYEIMINTSVFDRPSFTAKEVEELYVGDKVRVEARLGRWLKVRSRNGEPGYIMSQDAQKLFD